MILPSVKDHFELFWLQENNIFSSQVMTFVGRKVLAVITGKYDKVMLIKARKFISSLVITLILNLKPNDNLNYRLSMFFKHEPF